MTFIKGDVVRCIDNRGAEIELTVGKTYTITEDDNHGQVRVYCDKGFVLGFFETRFVFANTPKTQEEFKAQFAGITELCQKVHASNREAGWWDEKDNPLVVPTKLALVHSEVSEALEGHRRSLMDDHLPQHTMLACELADVLIRVYDLVGFLGIDISQVLADKAAYNAQRQDHKPENRAKQKGKKY